ncbi:hypothetical protein HAX54_002837 [Datura stramonium]|uniref:Uncharacterized protein n=1 Tax=Datura stramonium TaxID=4076 RepID=A0ABS8T5M1_DATST|nr:hypothetical protein [Datura stramonium]
MEVEGGSGGSCSGGTTGGLTVVVAFSGSRVRPEEGKARCEKRGRWRDVVAFGGRWKRSLPEMETGEGRERGVATLNVVAHGNGSGVFVLFLVTAGDKADNEGEGRSGVGPEQGGRGKRWLCGAVEREEEERAALFWWFQGLVEENGVVRETVRCGRSEGEEGGGAVFSGDGRRESEGEELEREWGGCTIERERENESVSRVWGEGSN